MLTWKECLCTSMLHNILQDWNKEILVWEQTTGKSDRYLNIAYGNISKPEHHSVCCFKHRKKFSSYQCLHSIWVFVHYKAIKNDKKRYLAKTGLMLTLKGYYIDLLCIHRIVFCMNKIKTDSPLSDESLKNQSNLYTDLHI